MTQLSNDEHAALLTFKAAYGREWKAYLRAAWMSESYKGLRMGGHDTGILRDIRNMRGPTWLNRVKI